MAVTLLSYFPAYFDNLRFAHLFGTFCCVFCLTCIIKRAGTGNTGSLLNRCDKLLLVGFRERGYRFRYLLGYDLDSCVRHVIKIRSVP